MTSDMALMVLEARKLFTSILICPPTLSVNSVHSYTCMYVYITRRAVDSTTSTQPMIHTYIYIYIHMHHMCIYIYTQ